MTNTTIEEYKNVKEMLRFPKSINLIERREGLTVDVVSPVFCDFWFANERFTEMKDKS
jgi:hypothetical protein